MYEKFFTSAGRKLILMKTQAIALLLALCNSSDDFFVSGIDVVPTRWPIHQHIKTEFVQVCPKAKLGQGRFLLTTSTHLAHVPHDIISSDIISCYPQPLFEYIFHHENDVRNVSMTRTDLSCGIY